MSIYPNQPAASYKFNQFEEIKSHSSYLFNERLAILWWLGDMRQIRLHTYREIGDLLEVKSIMWQIYKNIRSLIRNNPTMRASLNLETKNEGIYVTDLMFGMIERMVEYCQVNGYTVRKLHIIMHELDSAEIIIKDILQYYNYFIRPDFKQKPDVDIATEMYKEIADKSTIEELKQIVGKKHHIDFDHLGSDRVELRQEIEYEKDLDGEYTNEEEEDIEEDVTTNDNPK